MRIDWKDCAELCQKELAHNFWNEDLEIMNQEIMNQELPLSIGRNDHLIYWWHAHVIDVLVDGYNRTNNEKYIERINKVIRAVIKLNGHTILHNYYDDMEWMALALLRAYDATKDIVFKEHAIQLWENIKTAWNDNMGGGMAWKKDQKDYKNTPANAPASILAARLYHRFGDVRNLEWAIKIYDWNKKNLVDPSTGYVWDGINRLGDKKIDYNWNYTYNQGVYIGAGVELYQLTGEISYISDAIRTAEYSLNQYTNDETGILPNEGPDDCGLFKGIYIRYLYELYKVRPELRAIKNMIIHNSEIMWQKGRDEKGLISRSWQSKVEPVVQLCAQLSGIMLIEITALLGPNFENQ